MALSPLGKLHGKISEYINFTGRKVTCYKSEWRFPYRYFCCRKVKANMYLNSNLGKSSFRYKKKYRYLLCRKVKDSAV